MKPIAVKNTTNSNELVIELVLGTTCNFSCSYCSPACHDGGYSWPEGERLHLLQTNLSYMLNTFKEYGKTNFSLLITGGEPTLWPGLSEFVKYFKENYNLRITLNSNGSRTLRWWKENAHFFNLISISVHNQEADINHIISILDWIYLNTDVGVHAAVLMDNTNWDYCTSIVDKLTIHPVPWLLRLREVIDQDSGNLKDYTSEQIQYLKKKTRKSPPNDYIKKMKALNNIQDKGGKILTVYEDGTTEEFDSVKWYSNNLHYVNGWKCNLGIDRFIINPIGNITGNCGAINVYNFKQPLNIYDPTLVDKFLLQNIVPLNCNRNSCPCSSELAINKEFENDI